LDPNGIEDEKGIKASAEKSLLTRASFTLPNLTVQPTHSSGF